MKSDTRTMKGPQLFDQPLPADMDAEEGVLGSLLLYPESVDEVSSILKASDFLNDAHRRIYAAIEDMRADQRKIDATLLVAELRKRKELDLIGGMARLAKLAKAVPHAAHLVYYANIVVEESTRRALIQTSTETIRDAYDRVEDARTVLTNAEAKLATLTEGRSVAKAESIKDILMDAIERSEARGRGESSAEGVRTGYAEFDGLTGGLHPGELVILAARPSMGKTALALNIAANASMQDQEATVLFVSLEMSRLEMGERLLSSEARIDGHRLRKGMIGPEDRTNIRETFARINNAGLFVEDSPYRKVNDIAAAARVLKRREGKLSLVIVDYLQLIEPDDSRAPREQQVARMTRRLKGLARDLGVPVLCLAQLNRQTEAAKDNRPRLSHLRESGAIEQDADVVLFVHREEYYLPKGQDPGELAGQAEIIVAKQRNGPTDTVKVRWSPRYTRFDDGFERHDAFDAFNDRRDEPGDAPAYSGSFEPSHWDGPSDETF